MLVAIFILVILPFLLGRWNNKFKNYFGYGIPILFLLVSLYYFVHDKTCTGTIPSNFISLDCNLLDNVFAIIFIFLAAIFSILYTVSLWFKKRNEKFSSSLIMFFGIVIILSLVIFLLMPLFDKLL